MYYGNGCEIGREIVEEVRALEENYGMIQVIVGEILSKMEAVGGEEEFLRYLGDRGCEQVMKEAKRDYIRIIKYKYSHPNNK